MELLDVFKALSNETRLQIIQWLKNPEIHFPKPLHGDINEDGVCVSDIHKKWDCRNRPCPFTCPCCKTPD
ncbi:hypothetical protein PACILC2_01200 [Paenibacillus cisolokensis]|uniref:Transcriptional regulator n=1 Tax=Paenibacillus cisolokensis TaxID=1658519 RepID=A0ABQ4N095_9BACL|nr:hypothetical protein PACILC2_01200 [Paenibacillus cisolokensis]